MDNVPVKDIVAAELLVLKHVDPKVMKVLKAQGKISPALNSHLQQQMGRVPFPRKA
jgi:F-type H+-transporting ATPase subunit alpha